MKDMDEQDMVNSGSNKVLKGGDKSSPEDWTSGCDVYIMRPHLSSGQPACNRDCCCNLSSSGTSHVDGTIYHNGRHGQAEEIQSHRGSLYHPKERHTVDCPLTVG